MENTLKLLREKAGLTQEVVADRLEMTVGTIQNWERTGKIQKEQLHNLLDLYGVGAAERNRVVLDIFGDDRKEEEKPTSENDNFPYFLFTDRPDIVAAAKRAELSVEEMELFGYTYYLRHYVNCNDNYAYGRIFPIEYRVFEKFGGYFPAMHMIAAIKGKIGEYGATRDNMVNISPLVYNFGISNPDIPFSFCKLGKTDIIKNIHNLPGIENGRIDVGGLYSNCKAVQEPIFLGTNFKCADDADTSKEVRDLYKSTGYYRSSDRTYELQSDGITEKCIEITKTESTNEDYAKRKKQYLSDRDAYDAHPNLFDRAPQFNYMFKYYIGLTDLGREYIRWYEK